MLVFSPDAAARMVDAAPVTAAAAWSDLMRVV